MTSAPVCRACGAVTTANVTAREMMLGLRDEFVYDECGACGAVQLRTPPADPSRYYPRDYYSLQPPTPRDGLWAAVRRARNVILFRNPLGVGRVLAALWRRFPRDQFGWFAHTRTKRASRILDVGAGVGLLVRDLGEAGFTSVLGIDPFLDTPVQYAPGVRVDRATLHDVDGEFDLIMFHHSLEHIREQDETLRRAAELLAPGGWCLVRVPVASSFAWRQYREHWVQLDAPRHEVIHSVASLTQVAGRAGLRLVRVEHDSSAFQFLGSEAYRRDVPLAGADALFTRAEIADFGRRAQALNAQGQGDQACFYFRKG